MSESFVQLYRALAWTRGFDLHSQGDQRCTTVLCETHRHCTFTVTAHRTPAKPGKPDVFVVSTNPFHVSHNHPAPFFPLSLASENTRRAALSSDDPSLHTPPLLANGEFSAFLELLNPELVEYLPLLDKIGITPTMSVRELYDLGEKDLREAMEDAGLPLFVKYEITAGLMRAGRRKEGEREWDGRPARGRQAERIKRWIGEAIGKGEEAMQASAGGRSC